MRFLNITKRVVYSLLILGLFFGFSKFQTPVYAAPLFTQCPAIGADSGCGILITFNADGTTTVSSDPSQPPYDSVEDTLIGVQNNTGVTIPNTVISGTGIFGLDGDGICSGSFSGTPVGCPFGSTKYEGPNTSFSIVDANNGTVNFTSGGLAANTSTYFSLEGKLTASSITIPQRITLNPPTATNDVGAKHTVTATVAGSAPVPGVTVTFTVTSGPDMGVGGTAVTDVTGHASFTYSNTTGVGTDIIQACFVDNTGTQQCTTATKNWVAGATTTTYTGVTTSDFNDPAILSANLVDSSNNPISGAVINFSLGSQTCSGTTDMSGNASCTLTPNEAAGTYSVMASFAGDASHQPSSTTGTFTVTLEETTTSYTGAINIAQNQPVSAVLKEDGLTAISGRTLTLSLATGESCTGTTDAGGNVSCMLSGYPLGPNTITASFAGDTFYKVSSDSKAVLIFAALSNSSFVLGDKTVTTASSTTDLTWWGAQWSKMNTLTGGATSDSFKGFADTLSSKVPTCGGTWTTDPGNSSKPPTSVPSYMAVIVADSISKSGSIISGDIPKIVIVKTDSGYANNPGHAGTGMIVATLCGK